MDDSSANEKREREKKLYLSESEPSSLPRTLTRDVHRGSARVLVVFGVSMSNVLSARRDIKFFEFRLTGTVIYGKTLLPKRRKSYCGENGVRRRRKVGAGAGSLGMRILRI